MTARPKYWVYISLIEEDEICFCSEEEFGRWVVDHHRSFVWGMDQENTFLRYAHGTTHQVARRRFSSKAKADAFYKKIGAMMKDRADGFLLQLTDTPQ